VTLSNMKIYFLACYVFCHFLPEKRHFLAPPVQNGKKCDDSAGTETRFSLPVSDKSDKSETGREKAISDKTGP